MRVTQRVLVAVAMAAALGAGSLPAARGPGQLVGGVQEYTVARGDTLRAIGSRFGVEPAVLTAENGLKADAKLQVGQILHIDNRHIAPESRGVPLIINVPQRMVFRYGETGDVVSAYPVAIGRAGWATPRGRFTIISKETNPTWDVPASILEEARRAGRSLPARVPPGPDNPLGAHWIGLSLPGIGLHGTNAPSSVFTAASHGCLRMHPDDVAALFEQVKVGDAGESIYEPVLLAEIDGRVYLEVHRDVYRRLSTPVIDIVRERAAALGISDRIDWPVADRVASARGGLARDVTRR